MAKLVQLKDSDGNVFPRVNGVNDLIYTEVITLASNLSVNANSNTANATYTLSPRTGYTPIFVALNNTWGGQLVLWYCNLNGNQINWRVRNVTNSQVTGFTIKVNVLYIKTNSFTT